MYLVLPSIIISFFAQIEFSPKIFYLASAGCLSMIFLGILGWLVAKLLGLKDVVRGTFILLFFTLEVGAIGYVLMLAVYGNMGLEKMVIAGLFQTFIAFTFVPALASYYGKAKGDIKKTLMSLFSSPIVWSIFIGIALNILNYQSEFLNNLFQILNPGLLLLFMIIVGLEFEPKINSFKLPILIIFFKTIFGLVIGLFLVKIFHFGDLERISILMMATLPSGMIMIPFAQEYKLDTKLVANTLSIALPLSLIFYLVLLNFV